jgi:tetratricopeptide (TPR) repeat protein
MANSTRIARITLVAALALALGACGGAEDRKAHHQQRGDELFAAGDYEKARVEYKNVLQIDPKDVKARLALAQSFEKLERWNEAAGHYKAVVDEDAKNVESRVQLARLFLLGNALEQSQKLIDEALAVEPSNAEALAVRGGIKARGGDRAGAQADADAALAADPKNVAALTLAASLSVAGGDSAKAIDLLTRAVAADTKNAAVRAALAGLHVQKGDNDRAVQLFKEIADLEPDKLAHRLRLAALYTGLKQLDAAEQVLRDTVAARPDDAQAKLALAEFLASQRSREAAERELRAMIDKEPDAYPLRFGLARLLEATRDVEGAKQVYRDVIARAGPEPQGLEARTKLARLLGQQNQMEEAGKLVAEVLAENPKDEDALVLRGGLAMVRNDPLSAIADYRAALKGRPNSAELLVLLARAHLENKEPELAQENLRKAVEAEPGNLMARLQLAQYLAQTGKADAALEQLDAGLKAAPGNGALLEAKTRLQLAKRDWDGAAATAKVLEKAGPERPIGYLLSGLALQGKGEYAASVTELERAVGLAPKAAEPITALVQTLLLAKEPDKALARLEKNIAEQGDSAHAWNLKGEVLLVQKQNEPAEAAFKKAVELSPQASVPYRNLALAGIAAGDSESAVQAFRQGVEATGGQPMLRFQLANLYEQLGRYDEAIAEHEAMLKQNPDSVVVANNLAMLLVTYRTDAASLARAAELAARLEGQDNPAFLDTLGWIQYKRGELEAAIRNLSRAVDKAPAAGIMQYHLGMAYYAKGDLAQAKDHLGKALAAEGQFVGIEEARATLEKLDVGG